MQFVYGRKVELQCKNSNLVGKNLDQELGLMSSDSDGTTSCENLGKLFIDIKFSASHL
jgi:hypothetical protein